MKLSLALNAVLILILAISAESHWRKSSGDGLIKVEVFRLWKDHTWDTTTAIVPEEAGRTDFELEQACERVVREEANWIANAPPIVRVYVVHNDETLAIRQSKADREVIEVPVIDLPADKIADSGVKPKGSLLFFPRRPDPIQ